MWKKLLKGLESTPQAPKPKPLPLPEVGEGDAGLVPPPLVEGWASSDSGSSVSSSSPSTPSTSPAPWRRPITPYKAPLVRAETPQHEIRSPAWHVMTSEMEKSLCRQTLTPSPEILKPRPRRASSTHHPTPVQVMQGLVSPQPMPAKPIKSILKHSAPPSSAAPTPAPALQMNQIGLHWQLCPYETYKRERQLRVEFDISKPVELIVIRDLSHRVPRKLTQAQVEQYLQRKVCEAPPLCQMNVRYTNFPSYSVTVSRPDGGPILVRDVFQAMFDDLYKPAYRKDRREYITLERLPACEEAFLKRCKESTQHVYELERKVGMRRVDMLAGDSFFVGLTRPTKDDQDFWIANFGPAPQ